MYKNVSFVCDTFLLFYKLAIKCVIQQNVPRPCNHLILLIKCYLGSILIRRHQLA